MREYSPKTRNSKSDNVDVEVNGMKLNITIVVINITIITIIITDNIIIPPEGDTQ